MNIQNTNIFFGIAILILVTACGKNTSTTTASTPKNTSVQTPNARTGRVYNTHPGNFTGNYQGSISISNGTRIGNGKAQISIIQSEKKFKEIDISFVQSGFYENIKVPVLSINQNNIYSSDFEPSLVGKIDQKGFMLAKTKDIKLSVESIDSRTLQVQFSINTGTRNFKTGSGILSRINP